VPASGPREKVEVGDLIDEIAARQRTLRELFAAPTPEMAEAMVASRETILALLTEGAGTKSTDDPQ
jgi:hypothetical protein